MATYNFNSSDFLNNVIDIDSFTEEIRSSNITIALDYVMSENGLCSIVFKDVLSTEEETLLTTLVNNHTGEISIDNEPIIVRSEILTEHVKWVQSGQTTQTLFLAESLIIDISTGESQKIIDFSWPLDIALMSASLAISEEMVGDDFEVFIAPNTLVGAATQPISVGDTSINVTETIIQNIKKGFNICKYNSEPSSTEEFNIGAVLSIDDVNLKLNLIKPSLIDVSVGSYLSMSTTLIRNLYLHSQHTVDIGKTLPTGQRIPANVPIRILYHNNNGVQKKISFFVEYLY